LAKTAAMFTATVLLPTPPFPLIMAILCLILLILVLRVVCCSSISVFRLSVGFVLSCWLIENHHVDSESAIACLSGLKSTLLREDVLANILKFEAPCLVLMFYGYSADNSEG